MWGIDNGKGLWTWSFPNFSRSEFACPCCGWDDIDRMIPALLQEFRDYLNSTFPPLVGQKEYKILVQSGCRCPNRNARVKGSSRSQHMKGKAVDFVVPGLKVQDIMLRIAQLPSARAWIGYIEPAGGSATSCHIDVRKPNTQALRRWQRVGRG